MRSGVARTATKQAARRLGTYLRHLRTGQGWTQSQVAEKVEVDAVTIRRWELGMFSPSMKNTERLASIYGVGVDDLRSGRRRPDWRRDARTAGISDSWRSGERVSWNGR